MRPASSNSSNKVATAAADNWHWRTTSSTATGVGLRISKTKSRPESSSIDTGVGAVGGAISGSSRSALGRLGGTPKDLGGASRNSGPS
jgi:hypothetical protein